MKNRKIMPFVSLVIVNFNGRNILRICLTSLLKLDYPKNKYEVIIVDNASTDRSIEFLKQDYPSIKIVKNDRNLGYVGINKGVECCKGEYIYFLNNDLTLKKDCLKLLVKELETNSQAGMAAHNAVNYFDRKIVSGGTWVSRAMYCGHYPKQDNKKTKVIPYLGGGLIRKSVIEKYGYLFDPDYFIYAEDLDLGLRIRLLGMDVVLVSDALCYHMHSVTTGKISTPAKNTFYLERNLLMTFLKIFSAKNLFLYSPLVIFSRFLTILKDLLSLKIRSAWARIYAISWVIGHAKAILEKRNQIQKLRKADDSFVLKVFSERYIFKKPFLI